MRLGNLDVYCVHTFFATLGVKGDLVTLTDDVYQTADVYKDFFFRRVVDNKAKAFGFVEEFYSSTVHYKKLKIVMWLFAAAKIGDK